MTIAEAIAAAVDEEAVTVLVGGSDYISIAAATAANTPPSTANPTANPTVSPTLSCPVHFAARDDRRSGAHGYVRSVHDDQVSILGLLGLLGARLRFVYDV